VRGSLTSRLPVMRTTKYWRSESGAIPTVICAVKPRTATRLDVRLISSVTVDAFQARVSVVVELGTFVHSSCRIAPGTAGRDGGRRPRYAGASDRVRAERRGGPIHDPCLQEQPAVDCDRGARRRRLAPGRGHSL